MQKTVGMGLVLALISGCTWVELSPEAKGVRFIETDEAQTCQRLGTSTAKSASKIAFINRNSEKVKAEVRTLAQNEAVSMGGNAVLPVSKLEEGRQRYTIYFCSEKN